MIFDIGLLFRRRRFLSGDSPVLFFPIFLVASHVARYDVVFELERSRRDALEEIPVVRDDEHCSWP
ncbi:hypothetical protein D3C83_207150 [compost metagenome]